MHPEATIIRVGDVEIGGDRLIIIAGPCAVEERSRTLEIARLVRQCGALLFRGGAFKPRTSPYSFQGLGEEGLKILAEVRQETGMGVVTEMTSPSQAELMVRYVDVVQIGARNMQNFELLKCVGRIGKPVLLKRGLAATIEEWLMSAEYILSEGNDQVILCERGIRTFETYTRNTLDLTAVPVIKELTHLPIIIDPSHATGIREKVSPMARAAIAAGADGLTIEVHNEPDKVTAKEYALLEYLAAHAGRVLSRTMIVEHVWDESFEGLTNIVDVYVRHLREKVDEPFEQKLIRTVRGVGYCLTDEAEP